MFIGHFAIAFLLWRLFPQVPLPIILVSVSFPDLLWAILVPAGIEKVKINPDSALQKNVVFESNPYSHSLLLTNIWSLFAGLTLTAILGNPIIASVFVIGSASHWILDTVVHLKDLPILGFDGDRKVGAGLWKRGSIAAVVEYAFYVIICAVALTGANLVLALILGTIFHTINLPSFIGSNRKNIVKTSNGFAGLVLFGFGAFTLIASLILK